MKVGSYKIKTKRLIAIGIALSIAFIMYSVVTSGLQDQYEQDLQTFRDDKDEHFKMDRDSPIEDPLGFKGLRYFPANKEGFRVKARLQLLNDSTNIKIINNDGEKNDYIRYAYAIFKIKGVEDTLTVFRKKSLEASDPNFFLPFFDASNGDETYEGGRYLDLRLDSKETFVLDFNFAYNPYCVYNYRFSCPIPPLENKVDYKIEAGERTYLK